MSHPFQTASDVRKAGLDKCIECGAEAPAHYGSCSKVAAIPGMTETLAALDKEAAERKERDAAREKIVAPYGRNRFGAPNRPNDYVKIVIYCDNPEMGAGWLQRIRNDSDVCDALPPALDIEVKRITPK